MKFFFDNCLSPKYAQVLQDLGENIVHLQDCFPDNTNDEDWIPKVASKGWTVVTFDKAIKKTPQIKRVLLQYDLLTYFLPSQIESRRLMEQAAWLLKHWEGIRDHAFKRSKKGAHLFVVQQNGQIRAHDEHVKKRQKRRRK